MNKHVAGSLGPGNQLAWDKRVRPAIVAELGCERADRFEVRGAMSADPYDRLWSAMRAFDMHAVLETAGLPRDCQFEARLRAVVDEIILPPSVEGDAEDFERAAVWQAYGAWKPA